MLQHGLIKDTHITRRDHVTRLDARIMSRRYQRIPLTAGPRQRQPEEDEHDSQRLVAIDSG